MRRSIRISDRRRRCFIGSQHFAFTFRMAKGLGTTQRALLIAAARLTIAEVDGQARRQELCITPPILSMEQLLRSSCEHGLPGGIREPRRGDCKRLKPHETSRKMLDRRYNPSRVAASLEDRGFLLWLDVGKRKRRSTGLGSGRGFRLTGPGLGEAIRLGGLQSEVVDLKKLVENLSKASAPENAMDRAML
jgi:hypothetical protein